ncbi:MAG TPA: DMT family transporter [Polyangiaceae bacterium]|jgi:drug/metabolite transporter (DMT)-like permease|nr:DMT family transporter [Polyangiaceae bacterium]
MSTLYRSGSPTRAPAAPALLLALVAVAAFGLTLPLTRVAVSAFGAFEVTAARAAIAGVIAGVLLLVERAPLPSAAAWRQLVVIALGSVIGFPLFAALAMGRAPVSHGAVVIALVPLLTAVIGSRLAAERLPRRFWAASLFGTLAVGVFALRGARAGIATADLFLVGAVVCAAVGYAYGGRLSRSLPASHVIYWALVLCLPLSLAATVLAARPVVSPVHAGVWVAMAYLALVSQLGGFVIWNRALAVGGVARTSQTQLLQPFVSLTGAAWLADEVIHADAVVFAGVVALSLAVGRSRPRAALGHAVTP